VDIYFYEHVAQNPRAGHIFTVLFLWAGKWLFVIANAAVQTGLAFSVFYFIFMRKPDFKTVKDIYPFALICLLSVMAVVSPDNVLFWIGGACNYSWMMLCFMIVLILLRGLALGRDKVKNNPFIMWGLLALCFLVGDSNENNGPMALGLFAFTAVACYIRGIKLPKWFYFALTGIILGLLYMFTSPALYTRANNVLPFFYVDSSFTQRLFFHLYKENHLIFGNLLLAPAAGLILIMALALETKRTLSNNDAWTAAVCLGSFVALSLALSMAPASARAFYSASVFGIMAFLLMVKFLCERFGKNILRPLFFIALIVFIVFLPAFTLPYLDLRRQDRDRQAVIKSARGDICVPPLTVIAGPTSNLSLTFYEPVMSPRFKEVNKLKHDVRVCPAEKGLFIGLPELKIY
ncbi:MAG: DUF6056 family protein, partial [Elusimicrobiota bacterium]|nr:DUF6056 family protein [Elusimicrobiota bacterium]